MSLEIWGNGLRGYKINSACMRCIYVACEYMCSCVLVCFLFLWLNIMNKSTLVMKKFIWLTLPCRSPSLWEVRAGTQVGAVVGTVEKCCLQGLLPMACSACFPIYLRTTCPEVTPPTVGEAFPNQLIIENVQQTHLEAISSVGIPSSLVSSWQNLTSVCYACMCLKCSCVNVDWKALLSIKYNELSPNVLCGIFIWSSAMRG